MPTLNQCSFIGYVGKDPVLDVTSEGTPYTRFSLAVEETKKKSKKKQEPMWLNITCWGKLAELMEKFLYKGALVFVQGRLQLSTPFTDKGGVLRQALDIIANDIQLLDKKPEDAEEPEAT